MTEVKAYHVLLFGFSGAFAVAGSLLLTGFYFVEKSYPLAGIVFYIFAFVCGAIFVALVD